MRLRTNLSISRTIKAGSKVGRIISHHSAGKAAVRNIELNTGEISGRDQTKMQVRIPNNSHLFVNGLKLKAER